jgi:AcrR family transcriptional regulator
MSESGSPDSPRKRELLEAAYRYVLGNGLAGMSLRPLAKAIGSSPRVLLFLFGSKEGLIRALLARAREDELRYLEELRDSHRQPGGLAAAGREVWSWLAAPSHRALLALWVEGYGRSLLGEPGPWASFGKDTVRDWLGLLAGCQPAAGRDTAQAEAESTLMLAVLRGALLDLLATGDIDRVSRAVERHLKAVRLD